ncbi:MAG: hypothetical protein GXY48_12455 [Methanomicrobiales archaeon]|nr:hypothetical protein [Methanomicrobiales archaeon]
MITLLPQGAAAQLGNDSFTSQVLFPQTKENITIYSLSDLPDVSENSNNESVNKIQPFHTSKTILHQESNYLQPETNHVLSDPLHILTTKKDSSDFDIQLYPGWNFVSTPRMLSTGNNTFEIFDTINTGHHSIYRYDPMKGWKKVYKTELFKPFTGIWIYSRKMDSIPLYYESGLLSSEKEKKLKKGWNAIGLYTDAPTLTSDALSSISEKWVFLIPYNTTTHTLDTPIIKGWKGRYSDQYLVESGKGYWLFMGSDGILKGNHNNPDLNVTGTVKYNTQMENGWSFSVPGTIKGSIDPDTGQITIESTDASVTYGGKLYPLNMNIRAFIEQ